MFVPNLQGTASKNTVLYSTSDIAQMWQDIALPPSTFLWALQSFSQSEALLDKSYTTGRKQERNGAKGNKQKPQLNETSREQASEGLQLCKSFKPVVVLN